MVLRGTLDLGMRSAIISFYPRSLLDFQAGKIVMRRESHRSSSLLEDASKPGSNASLVMEALLLASLLSCSDAQWIVQGVVNNNANMSRTIQLEIIKEIREVAPEDCNVFTGDERYPDESTS